MARQLSAPGILAYVLLGSDLRGAAGKPVTMYLDTAGTPADIAAYDGTNTPGASIPGSTVLSDSYSVIPQVWYPDGVKSLYYRVSGGPYVKVDAPGGGGDVTSVNGHIGVVVLTAADVGAGNMTYRGAWVAGTVYAVNDVVTLAGEVLRCAVAHTAGASFALTNWTNLTGRPGVYNVMLYGAKGDNATDDTVAINAAITAAYAGGQADGTYHADVHFPPGTYVLSGATTKGGATQGNAQVPLPVVPTTGRKFVLELTGTGDGSAFAHWEQTVGQRSGAVLRSTLTGQTVDGTWGVPSVVGGPTVSVGSGVYTNLKLVVNGITVMAPSNPSLIGFSLRYLAQATIVSAAALANAGPAGVPSLTTLPSDSNGIGLQMPQNGNNDAAVVVDYACEGFYYGMSFGEHFTALRVALIYCQVGIFIGVASALSSFHGASIVNLNVEASGIAVQCGGTVGGTFPLWVGLMSVETMTIRDFDDSNNSLTGWVQWSNTGNNVPTVNGAANLKIIGTNLVSKHGAATAPGVPGSTTPLTNPFFRDAVVVVTGGTVSAVAVDGVAQGFTATGFTVVVPSGKTITLTYTVAPSWKWILL